MFVLTVIVTLTFDMTSSKSIGVIDWSYRVWRQ